MVEKEENSDFSQTLETLLERKGAQEKVIKQISREHLMCVRMIIDNIEELEALTEKTVNP